MTSAQIKNSFSSIGEVDAGIAPSSLVLKLSFSNDAVRYFVSSITHSQIIFFGNYTLHYINQASELAQRLEKIFEKDEILQLPFAKVLIGVNTNYSLVPDEFSFMINRLDQLTNRIDQTELVFECSDQVVSVLKKQYSGFELIHLSSTFLKVLPKYNSENGERLFVNVGPNYLDIIRFDSLNRLKLLNRYSYEAATDFIYYVLLCCEELSINRETTELLLIGEVDIQSKIYDLCYRYFRHISFIQKPEEVNFSKAFDIFPKHLHFNLYNLSL
ncbi:MAG: DUF3822 family protein [Chitinophagales bacterium]